jgi:phosphoglycerate dehydrogenase-like enzyme
MRTFRIALTGDFLDEQLVSAYGDLSLSLWKDRPYIQYHFLKEQSPRPHDPSYWSRLYSMEVTPDQIDGVDGLVVLRPWVKRSVFARGAKDLLAIGRSGTGYDKIDVAACTENDVALFNTPDALRHSTASSALLFMLALSKRLLEQERIVRAARWDLQASVMGSELQGRTLGIIGLGHSGRELARLVAPFSMRAQAYSPHADSEQAREMGVELCSLETVLRESDFVSLHCRLTPQTRRMIGAAQLALMKPTAFFINVARGELVDQAALVDILREKRIAGAALDVFEVEPLALDDPLMQLDNVILTPHWLPATKEVWQATGRAMAEGMLRAAQGQVPENVVNTEVLQRPGFQAKLARFEENRSLS